MSAIGALILKIACAGIICAILRQIVGKEGFLSGTITFITGLYMLITVAGGIFTLPDTGFDMFFTQISDQADALTQQGNEQGKNTLSEIISQRFQAYILDKAHRLGAELTVEVVLSDDQIPVPRRVRLTGSISPYNKGLLSDWIDEQLGIGREDQVWIQ